MFWHAAAAARKARRRIEQRDELARLARAGRCAPRPAIAAGRLSRLPARVASNGVRLRCATVDLATAGPRAVWPRPRSRRRWRVESRTIRPATDASRHADARQRCGRSLTARDRRTARVAARLHSRCQAACHAMSRPRARRLLATSMASYRRRRVGRPRRVRTSWQEAVTARPSDASPPCDAAPCTEALRSACCRAPTPALRLAVRARG